MKKRLFVTLIMTFICLTAFSAGALAAAPEGDWRNSAAVSFSEGDGTAASPYLIKTAEDMALLSKNTTATEKYDSEKNADYYANTFFELGDDLDLSAHYWTPAKFNGYFNGNNHTITGLTVNVTKAFNESKLCTGAGLFSALNTKETSISTGGISVVENLHFLNPEITTALDNVHSGVLVGYAKDVRISNCTVSGGSVTNSSTVTAYGTGGLIGTLSPADCIDNFMIDRCSSTASISSPTLAGGLIGHIRGDGQTRTESITIANSWSGGDVTLTKAQRGGYMGGGLLGSIGYKAHGVNIVNCYSYGAIDGVGVEIGGLLGQAVSSGSLAISGEVAIHNSVALNPSLSSDSTAIARKAGRITSTGAALAAAQKGSFSNNYALDTMSVLGQIVADDGDTNGTGVMRDTTYQKSFWEDTAKFDFSESGAWSWDENASKTGYPTLKKTAVDKMALTIDMQPNDATAYKTMPATFGVKAAGGAMGYTYQWQSSGAKSEDWQNIEDATAPSLQVNFNDGYAKGTRFHCVVSDRANQTMTSDPAILTIISAKYTPDDAAKELQQYYEKKGTLTQAREAFSLSTLEFDLSQYATKLPFYNTYSCKGTSYLHSRGYFPWVLMDSYALGVDPHTYTVSGDGSVINFDMLNHILKFQNEETGRIFLGSSYFPVREDDLPVIISGIEMYFKGDDWGNEKDGTKLGRDGAIEYFFSQLKDHVSGGLTYGDMIKVTANEATWNYVYNQRTQSEAAILAARLSDDPKWGDEAQDALSGLLKTLDYLYDTRDEDTTATSFKYTESLARYVSALIAGSNATDNYFKKISYLNAADAIMKNDIITSKAIDGGYGIYAAKSPVKGDADATAAVMLALGDYADQSCALADYVFTVPDANAIANDLGAITINSLVTGDLTLPDQGAYGSKITWETSNKNIIALNGKVNRGQEDAAVTLTATGTKGKDKGTRVYELIVKAAADADTDGVDAALSPISLPIETIRNLTLEKSSVKDVTLTWSSSSESVIAVDGTVVRPAKGQPDVDVTLTATANQGSITKTKEFVVKVYAQTEDSLKEGYYLTRDKYLAKKAIGGYWDIWAAYSALGDYITDPANGYTLTLAAPANDWYGTQYGASVMALCAMGENPYNYNGKNWVKMLKDNYGGAYGGPVFSELGMEAAGASNKYYAPSADSGITGIENVSMGIDLAGWAAVVLASHKGEAEADKASEKFINFLKGLGSAENGNFMTPTGGSNVNCISTGCGLVGLASLYSVGFEDADVTAAPWLNATNGKGPVDAVYEEGLIKNLFPGYTNQMEMALCDLYNAKYKGGVATWISCGVSKDKLETQIAKANEILTKEADYTPESISTLKKALETVNSISEDRRNAKIPDYGEEYYTLFDAVRYIELVNQGDIDKEVAKVVIDQINQLPAKADVTLKDKAAVEKARAAYDKLTKGQKQLVETDILTKLTDAESVITALEKGEVDKTAAASVTKAINALPTEKNITLKDKEAVEAARTGYNALSNDQKALIGKEALAKLEAAEAKIHELAGKEVANIKDMSDIKTTDWFYDDVDYVLSNGIFFGTSATTFGANESMTRAQFVSVLGRYAGNRDSSPAYPIMTVFNDVKSGSYYASQVKWATEKGITVGTSATTFDPDASISRQDMAAMMLRFAKVMNNEMPAADGNLFADDSKIADYAKKAVYSMKAAKVLYGKENNNFDPQGKSLRSEVAAVLHRFLTLGEDVESVTLSMEKFTLGQGYVIEPTEVTLKDGDTAATVLERAAAANGIETDSNEATSSSYYLKSVKDNDSSEAVIPQYILDEIAKDTTNTLSGRADANWLGEFDYYYQSGWMVMLNHSFPGVSAGSTPVKDGDVIRWQYTLCGLGRDIGQNVSESAPAFIQTANKDALTTAVANASTSQKTTEAYTKAVETLKNLQATQEEVDSALSALK